MNSSPGIIQSVPNGISYLFLVPINGADHLSRLHRLAEQVDADTIVFDLGNIW
jgi:hypothetical protein